MNNMQAQEAGTQADSIITSLSTPSQPEEAAEQVPTPAQDGNWEARFKGYKKSSDTTIHTLRQQVANLDSLQAKVDMLERQNEDLVAASPVAQNPMTDLFSEEEASAVDKYVDSKVGTMQGEVDRLKADAKTRQDREDTIKTQSTHMSIVESVKNSVSNYDEIDSNPDFISYMNEPDNFGNIRLNLLRTAKSAIPPDIDRIVRFYIEFNATLDKEPERVYTQQELLQNPASHPSPRLEVEQPTSGTVWDQATISQFYKDKAIGKIGPKQAKALELEMYAALGGG